MANNPPPASLRAERAVLGAILLNNQEIADLDLRALDFSRPSHQYIFDAMLVLHRSGHAIDGLTLTDMLETSGDLGAVGGVEAIAKLLDGVPKSVNCLHYAAIVSQKSRRRKIQAFAERVAASAANGVTDDDLAALLADIPESTVKPSYWSDLSALGTAGAGQTKWLVENLIPADDFMLLAATWKTAKTLCCYDLVLSAITGTPVWGHFAVPRPLRCQVWQLEMPLSEDLRRLERLARGRGIDPTTLRSHPNLKWANRPCLDLTSTSDISSFHRAVLGASTPTGFPDKPDLIILDSALAAFSSSDLNDNAEVRRVLSRSLLPLTSRGVSVLVLHHYRKPSSAGTDDSKGKVLGAQAFAAAAGRIYGLERLPANPSDAYGSFKLKLGLLGSWSPGEANDIILGVEDTPDGQGTTVSVLDEPAQLAQGGISKIQEAALNIKNQLQNNHSVPVSDALNYAQATLGIGLRMAKSGLQFAVSQHFVTISPDKKTLLFFRDESDDLSIRIP